MVVVRLLLDDGRVVWILTLAPVRALDIHLRAREQFLFIVAAALPRVLIDQDRFLLETLVLT